MNNILELNLDKIYTDWVLNKTNKFQYIHPNVLSILGLFIDAIILYTILSQLYVLMCLCVFIRYSCDCLDGAIARKYNKVSNLGGLLDTIADNTLIYILSYGILTKLLIDSAGIISSIIVILNLIYLLINNSIIHHSKVKLGGSLFQNIYKFGINNNVILYTISAVLLIGLK